MTQVAEVALTSPLAGHAVYTSASPNAVLNEGDYGVAISGCVRDHAPQFMPAVANTKLAVEAPVAFDAATLRAAAAAADLNVSNSSGDGAGGGGVGASGGAAGASDPNATALATAAGTGGRFDASELAAVLVGGVVPSLGVPLATPLWQAPVSASAEASPKRPGRCGPLTKC